MWLTPKDTKRLSTTVCLLALQFNAVKKQFVATCKVPVADVQHSAGKFDGAAVGGDHDRQLAGDSILARQPLLPVDDRVCQDELHLPQEFY